MDSLKLIRKVTGNQCNCLSSGSDGVNRGVLGTTRARQFCSRWSFAKSLLAMLFSNELQQSRRLLIRAVDIVLALNIDMRRQVQRRNRICILEKNAGESLSHCQRQHLDYEQYLMGINHCQAV